jgi:DNA mismatch endonuclease (patch repair protein)
MDKKPRRSGIDPLDAAARSDLMRRIRSRNTAPERRIAQLLRSMRFKFTANVSSLPGTPDFLLVRHKTVVFVHGCFWHSHSCRRGKSMPTSRRDFWQKKKQNNAARDRRSRAALRRLGFSIVQVWQCELTRPHVIRARINRVVDARH